MFTSEIRESKILKAGLAFLPFIYFVVFYSWIGQNMVTKDAVSQGSYLCPPYFQSCEIFYWMQALPLGYSQTIWYMLLFGVLALTAYFLIEQRWRIAQLLLIIPYLWHVAHVLFFTHYTNGNFEYYLIAFATIFLFFPHKEFFAKLSIVLFYVMSTVAKMHPAWIAGGYFTNMQLGLPIFPDWSIPLFTNLVIIVEMVGAWFLMSKNKYLQRTVFVFFVIFHLYSGILVVYRYPATVLPMLVILFGPWYKYTPVPLDRRSVIPWILMALMFSCQFAPKFIEGDEKLTLEGNQYGLYMFESNHQCISVATTHYVKGDNTKFYDTSASARNRCDPYRLWFRYHLWCERDNVEKISWTFDHSINGEPFLRIVDVENVCDLEYRPFTHNAWIKTHEDNPEVIGRPVKNYYR